MTGQEWRHFAWQLWIVLLVVVTVACLFGMLGAGPR